MVEHANDEFFRSRGARRHADDFGVFEPVGIDLGFVIHQVSRRAADHRDFAQPLRVRTVLRADDQQHVDAR